ncbi:coenzyme F420-reducing hydrogenase, beta subunit [Phenylobacterium zucineum HLK1]|uniref:Coenzyme F420-reducing hydrogenase, beta subunit n=1 Tax=Phenylobacterium zucineum (strain HLK1) TaxID=450851 RepID=B4RFD9_PHEZH|nr:Coenzyme F420 hydrogenase/dehydrogenase, beta subunit C-terminal domain [Phenylobacterium zucineum]ACG78709.1 coenzyme F420-reducing hydrogenase, beta subunit [Phenylobacterium zucineum HLK1]
MRSPDAGLSPREVVAAGLCIGCGGCAAGGRTAGARVGFDRFGRLRPEGPKAWLGRRSEVFARTCPSSPAARDEDALALELYPDAPFADPCIGRFRAAYVGAAAEGDFRAAGSSGGMVTWTAAELMRRGLIDGVAHVKPAPSPRGQAPFFRYGVSRSEAELRAGAKSRYYPIEMSGVLDEIRRTPGRYAVVGVPCFIKAVRLLCREDPVLRERVAFTLGLFCGHMKSARLVESFAWQLGTQVEAVEAVDFRAKDPGRPANWYTAHLRLKDGSERRQDWWHLADGDWGAGFFQYPACDFCDDVTAETADISFGDAWVEPYSSDGRGTNVVVVRSSALAAILAQGIEEGRLDLSPVDADFVHGTQAAGFRQRREGLSLRLAGRRRGLTPRKRVPARAPSLTWRRRAVYRLRQAIAAGSHRVFWAAQRLRWPGLYTRWARASLAVYQGLAWSHGRVGRIVDRLDGKRA